MIDYTEGLHELTNSKLTIKFAGKEYKIRIAKWKFFIAIQEELMSHSLPATWSNVFNYLGSTPDGMLKTLKYGAPEIKWDEIDIDIKNLSEMSSIVTKILNIPVSEETKDPNP